jgi:hypothetical protein
MLRYLLKMDLNLDNFYKNSTKLIKDSTIDLSNVEFVHPWSIVMICLLLIERSTKSDKKLILPTRHETKSYLRRMCFEKILNELGYTEEANALCLIGAIRHHTLNVQEITHCLYRDEFNARLGHFLSMFTNFGLNQDDAHRATALVGELGNNVFDHNLGNWPTSVVGCIIAAQHYPRLRKIEISVGDPGVGFYGSLKAAFPNMGSDIEAIKLGLAGNTGRIGEIRGNGLKLIQQWTIQNFCGKVMIHSREGLVTVAKAGMKEYTVNKILGTLAQFVINYN